MNNEYVIINKSVLEKRIEELENELKDEPNPFLNTSYQTELDTLKEVLSQSTPLIPEIEKAFDEGFNSEEEVYKGYPTGKIIGKEDYISNLKLDV